jgi:CRP-like cAMP-binding protein
VFVVTAVEDIMVGLCDTSTGNRLLDRLFATSYAPLARLLETVVLQSKRQVQGAGRPFDYVYFPTSAVISTTLVDEEGREVETSTVGNEGMVSVYAIMGLDRCPRQCVCQVEGESLRAPFAAFASELARAPQAELLMKRYAAAAFRHAEQSILCQALHPADERLARWLLMMDDRLGTDELQVTHEFLAEMLGVRRPTVSLAASALQQAGLISYRRGVVRILQRGALEKAACECYTAMRRFNERLMEEVRA